MIARADLDRASVNGSPLPVIRDDPETRKERPWRAWAAMQLKLAQPLRTGADLCEPVVTRIEGTFCVVCKPAKASCQGHSRGQTLRREVEIESPPEAGWKINYNRSTSTVRRTVNPRQLQTVTGREGWLPRNRTPTRADFWRRQEIQAALDRMAQNQAALLRRVFLIGERPADIARDEGTTRQAIHSRLRKAKKALQRAFEGEGVYKRNIGEWVSSQAHVSPELFPAAAAAVAAITPLLRSAQIDASERTEIATFWKE